MKRIFLLGAVLFAAVAQVAAQNSFAYQAVIRNNGEVISNKDVALRISLSENSNVYYQETQKVKTNEYGNISINVGEGTVVSGSFSSVPWESLNVMMKLEVDAAGGSDFVELGSVQIKPAPYALYAAKAPTSIQPAVSSTEPIFAVKNSKGEVMFAVFEDGVKVYVNLDEDGSKAAKSRFAVAGRSTSKGEVDLLTVDDNGTIVYVDEDGSKAAKSRFAVASVSSKAGEGDLLAVNTEGSTFYVGEDGSKAAKSRFAVASVGAKGESETLMAIDENGTVVYVDDEAAGKAAKSRFAVAGRSAKGADAALLAIDGEGSTFYVDDPTSSKAAKSRFAVAGRSAKGADVLAIDGGGTTVYVDDPTSSKAAKSRFAVAGRSAKGEQTDVLTIDGKNSTFYFDNSEEGKAAKSRFAVAGRSAKSADDMFSVDNGGTVIYIDDDASGKAAKSRFAVAGRSAKGGDNYLIISNDSTRFYINDASETSSGFAVVGKSSSNALLSMNKDSVNFNTSMYVTGEVQTASGTVSRMANNSLPTKAYFKGEINNEEYSYNYYLNKNKGEYFELYQSGSLIGSYVILPTGKVYEKNGDNYTEKGNSTFGLFYLSEGDLRKLSADYNMELLSNSGDGILQYEPRNGYDNGNTPTSIATYYNLVNYLFKGTSDADKMIFNAIKGKLTTLSFVLEQLIDDDFTFSIVNSTSTVVGENNELYYDVDVNELDSYFDEIGQ
ncbi:MAG: hypothetical protein J5651_05015 [Salinivirgaceae bacterium]|nr:hypothetical protein [Salinivirgaceae bacterium]